MSIFLVKNLKRASAKFERIISKNKSKQANNGATSNEMVGGRAGINQLLINY